MSHRLGSILPVTPALAIGPATGAAPSAPGTWTKTFPVDPLAKFVVLYINGTKIVPGDRVEVDLGYDVDVYTPAWGPDFWTRPIRGDQPVTIRYVASAGSGPNGVAAVTQYGRGEGLQGGGEINTNADLFLLASPYQEPTFFEPDGLPPPAVKPTWLPASCITDDPVIQAVSASVGMYVTVHGDHLSSCTATLIGPDLLITAGHCTSTTAEARTGFFTLDYETLCDRSRPPGYSPRFHKLLRVVRSGYARLPGDMRPPIDYSVIQFAAPPGGIGAPPIPFRPESDPVMVGEPLFVVHHPRGTPKKVSRHATEPLCSVTSLDVEGYISNNCNIDAGSSGASLFDPQGRIVANASWYPNSQTSVAIWNDFITEPPPLKPLDVVLVLDRSGSMSLPGLTGVSKMEEARDAAALFVSLLRTDASHRVGLVSFSTTATPDFALDAASTPTRDALIGPAPPWTGGIVGGLAPGGATTIGGGLQEALGMFPAPSPAANTPAILLMTDGLENTAPFLTTVAPTLGNTRLNVVGFGTAASLDGPRLTKLAASHGGIYTRAHEGLTLMKFFALAFGRIFDYGTSLDPEYLLAGGAAEADPIPVKVCGDDSLTAVLGWAGSERLLLSVITPGGTEVSVATPGARGDTGATWAHLSLALPFLGERDGTWRVRVRRETRHESPTAAPAVRFFVTTLAEGGPVLRPIPEGPLYTGDVLWPRVWLRYPDGAHAHHVHVSLEVEAPSAGAGELLSRHGLGQATVVDGDAVDARTATLVAMEAQAGGALVPTSLQSFTLEDEEEARGALEPTGVFTRPLAEVARFEGSYTFHARATYGHDCTAARETTWSAHVEVGIDREATTAVEEPVDTLPDGRRRVRVVFTPRDRYRSRLGPGRADAFTVSPGRGCTLEGGVEDRGNGSYAQEVTWDPTAAKRPSILLAQPGRAPVAVEAAERSAPSPEPGPGRSGCGCLGSLLLLLGAATLPVVLMAILLA